MFGWSENLGILLRSPLCRHVAFAVFLSIIVIETIILVPSYFKQENSLLANLEDRARVAVSVAYGTAAPKIDQSGALSLAQRILSHREIKGVSVETPVGALLAHAGETVDKATAEAQSATRHYVYWPSGDMLPAVGIAVMIDRSGISAALRDYVIRIAGLVVLISAFVTLSTMAVLGRKLIFPMLKLRQRLVVDQESAEILEVPASNKSDEFGDFIRKFNGILTELYDIKQELEQRVAERTAVAVQTEKRLRAFIDHSPAHIYLKDRDSRVLIINKAYEKRYGITQEQAMGSQGHEWLGDENAERLRIKDLEVLEGGIPVETEFESSDQAGTAIYIHSLKFPVRNEADEVVGIGGIASDITERKKIEQDLRESQLAAEQASRIKSDFLATMSHEIRTPLHGILGTTGLILGTSLTDIQRKYVETIKQSGNSLLSLINSILDLSKIEADNLTLENVDFRLSQLLDGISALTSSHAQHKGVAFELTCEADVVDILKGDPNRIRQILFNLIGNATKFTEAGKISVRVSQLPHSGDRLAILFEVTDTGIGLTEEEQARVFDRFAQADGSITRKYGGTGLGLAICKELTELMGGEIGVRSKPDQGSTFWFTVSCEPGDPEKVTSDDLQVGTNASTAVELSRPVRILVAEDNPVNQLIATDTLESAGYTVDVVSNGLEAIEAVETHPYDLILMDMFMPEMDGMSAAKIIREKSGETAKIPIIALTADAMAGEREKYIAAGMNDYISKPFEPNQLFAAIRRFTDNDTGSIE